MTTSWLIHIIAHQTTNVASNSTAAAGQWEALTVDSRDTLLLHPLGEGSAGLPVTVLLCVVPDNQGSGVDLGGLKGSQETKLVLLSLERNESVSIHTPSSTCLYIAAWLCVAVLNFFFHKNTQQFLSSKKKKKKFKTLHRVHAATSMIQTSAHSRMCHLCEGLSTGSIPTKIW